MKLQLKAGEVYNAMEALKEAVQVKFPFKGSYAIKRLVQSLEDAYKKVEQKRNDLIVQYGEEKQDGNVAVKLENIAAFSKDFNQYLAETDMGEIECYEIPFAELGNVAIEPRLIIALDRFITGQPT